MLTLLNLAATLVGVALGYLFIRWFHAQLIHPVLGPFVARTFGIGEYSAGLLIMGAIITPLAVVAFLFPAP